MTTSGYVNRIENQQVSIATNFTKTGPSNWNPRWFMEWTCIIASMLLLTAASSGTYADDCQYIVKGRLLSRLEVPSGFTFEERYPGFANINNQGLNALPHVRIDIESRQKSLFGWGWYNTWDKIYVKANGKFEYRINKSCSGLRQLRIRAKFEDGVLRIAQDGSTSPFATNAPWYVIASDKYDMKTRKAGKNENYVVDFGDLVFEKGGKLDLGNANAYRHAQIWMMAKLMMRKLKSWGEWYRIGVGSKVKIKYPNRSVAARKSYANPITGNIYLSTDYSMKPIALWHEMFHLFAYDHATGESCLTADLLEDHNTHNYTNNQCSAFHEGFAGFAAKKLHAEIFHLGDPDPLSRKGLKNRGITDITQIDNLDDAYESLFLTLTSNHLYDRSFNTTESRAKKDDSWRAAQLPNGSAFINKKCAWKTIGLKGFLDSFRAGIGKYQINSLSLSGYSARTILGKVSQQNSEISEDSIDIVMKSQDPKLTFEPRDVLCKHFKLQPLLPISSR